MEDAIGALADQLAVSHSHDPDARRQLYELLYADLHRIARSIVAHNRAASVSPTSLVSEAWLRLARSQASLDDRRHFLSLVARAMRFAIIDHARRRQARMGDALVVPIDDHLGIPHDALDLSDLLALDAALTQLEVADPRAAQVVQLNYFTGMTMAEIGALLGVTERTIRRDWRRARAFLLAHTGTNAGGDVA